MAGLPVRGGTVTRGLGRGHGGGRGRGPRAGRVPWLPHLPGAAGAVGREPGGLRALGRGRVRGRRRDPGAGQQPPPRRRRMSLTIGVDVGGTKVAGGLVDEHGKVLAQHRVDTPARDAEATTTAIVSVIEAMRAEHDVEAVGHRHRRLRRRRPLEGLLRAQPARLARRAAARGGRAAGRPAGRRRERRERRGLGRGPVRRRARGTVHRLRDRRHRRRRRHHRRPGALPRRVRRRRRDRAHPDGRERPAVRLRPAWLLGAVRERRSAGA